MYLSGSNWATTTSIHELQQSELQINCFYMLQVHNTNNVLDKINKVILEYQTFHSTYDTFHQISLPYHVLSKI